MYKCLTSIVKGGKMSKENTFSGKEKYPIKQKTIANGSVIKTNTNHQGAS